MEFASDVTDKLQLPSPKCACSETGESDYITTRTSRFSYEKLYRVQRNCSKTAVSPYIVKEVCIDNTNSVGYAIGDYIQLDYGTPPLLLYVTDVYPATGQIYGINVVNRPTFNSVTNEALNVKSLSGNGTGAVVYVTARPVQSSCCCCSITYSCSEPFLDPKTYGVLEGPEDSCS